MSDVFDLMREESAKTADVEKQLNFEERIVKRLLKYAGITMLIGKAKNEAREKYGHMHLGFQWLRDEHPQFPVVMMAQKLKFTHKVTLADIYGQGRFKKLSWWQEYIDQAAALGVELETERAALVFNLPHAKDAFLMVLHNQPSQATIFTEVEQREEPWPRTTFPIGRTGIVAVLESLPSFLQTVGPEWAG